MASIAITSTTLPTVTNDVHNTNSDKPISHVVLAVSGVLNTHFSFQVLKNLKVLENESVEVKGSFRVLRNTLCCVPPPWCSWSPSHLSACSFSSSGASHSLTQFFKYWNFSRSQSNRIRHLQRSPGFTGMSSQEPGETSATAVSHTGDKEERRKVPEIRSPERRDFG